MKKFLLGFIVGMIVMIPVTAFGQTAYEKISAYVNPDIKVSVDGEYVNLDLAPIVYDQRTYLPVRELVEKVMGYEVNWVQETTTVEITKPDIHDIWPVKDISKVEGDAVNNEKEVKFNPKYYEIYEKDESLGIKEIKEKIRDTEIFLRQFKSVVENAEKYPENYKPTFIVDAYRDEIPKIENILQYWQERLAELENKQEK